MALISSLPNLRRNVILAPYTTYQIGGPAEYFVEVSTVDALVRAVRVARKNDIPYFLLGSGANILVSDTGIRGLVIHNRARHAALANHRITAESGAIIANLIEQTASAGLSGLEHFVGIPSTVGGALWQNLHFLAPDRTQTLFIGEILDEAKILDGEHTAHSVGPDYFQFRYDDSRLKHEPVVVLEATFALTPKSEAKIRQQMTENMTWRRAKQPQLDEFASCGSVFKKIEGVGAGRLIDQVGLKGETIGRAQISPKHANYIVNLGGATARDVKALIDLAHDTVLKQTGYDLHIEISLVGEWE